VALSSRIVLRSSSGHFGVRGSGLETLGARGSVALPIAIDCSDDGSRKASTAATTAIPVSTAARRMVSGLRTSGRLYD
jgi:hypothetical protein